MVTPHHYRMSIPVLAGMLITCLAFCLTSVEVIYAQDTSTAEQVEQNPTKLTSVQETNAENAPQQGDQEKEPFVPTLQYVEASDTIQLDHTDLNVSPSTQLDILTRAGTLGLNYCNDLTIHSGSLRVTLDLGDDYNYDSTLFSVAVNLRIEGVDTALGGSTVLVKDPVALTIGTDTPEQVYYVEFTGTDLANHDLVDEYRVILNSYSVSGSVTSDVRVTINYDDEYAVDAIRPSPDEAEPIVYHEVIDGYTGQIHTSNPLLLPWRIAGTCADRFPSFQIQIMRLFNTEPDYAEDPIKLKTIVDWSQAITIPVTAEPNGAGIYNYPITLSQGTGWYLWRIRPIGSKYPGGVADSRNWGVWSDSPNDGDEIDAYNVYGYDFSFYDTNFFYYRQFEDTLNWMHSRGFTEGTDGKGSKVAERMTFMTRGGRLAQSQVRESVTHKYHVTNSTVDFQGRSTLGFMSAPTGNGTVGDGFKYRTGFTTSGSENYRAKHFDDDANYDDPTALSSATLDAYWDGLDVAEGSLIPDAEGYPFSRVLLSTDGSGRPYEIGGVGETYRIGGGAGGQARTTRIYYASASDAELVRLFGDEAPADTSVYKMMVTGPNKVTSVSWIYAGRTIATALQVAQGDTLLLDLDHPSEPTLSGTISDTLRANRTRGGSSFSTGKRYAFADTTEVEISYRLTPDTITASALCVDTCVTCDYYVRLYVHPIDSDFPYIGAAHLSDPVVIEHALGGDPCGEGGTLDTTVTVTFPPGTYFIERRLETGVVDPSTVDPTNTPYGVTYAQQFRDIVAGGIRQKVVEDSSVAAVLNYLSTNDLIGLYEYLDLNLDSLSTYDYDTLTTECCEVIFPILSPDCGFNPCRDGTPDFEAYLFDTWGDEYGTDINSYFKYDGNQDVYPATIPSEPFNTLVANMLDDTDGSSNLLYNCQDLWYVWVGLVDAWEMMKTDPDDPENPAAFNPDFNLLDAFLQGAGVYLIDTSHTPYNVDNGYLLWAHRYVNKDVLTTNCKDQTGYNTSWHGNVDSSERWLAIKGCYDGGERENKNERLKKIGADCDLSDIFDGVGGNRDWNDPFDFTLQDQQDSCSAYTARQFENECATRCEERRDEFAYGIIRAYQDSGLSLCYEDALCMADAIVDSCLGECHLTIFAMSGHIDSIGTEAQWDGIERAMTWDVEFAVPVDDGMGGQFCSNDTMVLYEGYTRPFASILVNFFNAHIDEWVRNDGGTIFNVKEALRACSADSLVSLITDSLIFLPTFDLYSDTSFLRPYFELRDSCKIWYVTDTIRWSQIFPYKEHPMVESLNGILDNFWGYEIDSSVTGITSDCLVDTLGHQARVRKHASEVSFGSIADIYRDGEVIFVNGSSLYDPFESYFDVIVSNEYSLLLNNETSARLFSNLRFESTGSNPDVVDLSTAYLCTTGGIFLDIIHSVDGDNGCSIYDVTRAVFGNRPDTVGYGPPNRTIVLFDDQGFEGVGNLDEALELRYTEVVGHFLRTADDSLRFVTYYWAGHDPDTCTVFGTEFYAYPTKKLSDDVCIDKSCPDICWRWTEPQLDTAGTIFVGAPPCEETAARRIRGAINASIEHCIDQAMADLKDEYDATCGTPTNLNEEIIVKQEVDYVHFTLYYFDRAGQLVRTVPPKGVDVLSASATRMDSPDHTYVTEYAYNSLGQLIRTESPDGGESNFWYDQYGRLRFSQDARLAALGQYAYTKFDELGRVVETGVTTDSITDFGFLADSNINNRLFPTNGTERRYIAYDTSSGMNYLDATPQTFLRNRVSRTWTDDEAETHYSYDVHGNIEWVAQIVPGFPLTNYLKYDYDLISGNVNEVLYNEGRVDEFRHRYTYDADNALTEVETSYDGVIWESDARYHYYPHGAVRRIELGEDKLQGLDLTYTIQGQLKAINERSLTQADDPGEDGTSTYGHTAYAADSFALVMNYHENDFSHQTGTFNSGGADDLIGVPLYDGNISSVEVNVGKTTGRIHEELTGTSYRYDMLGRLDSSRFHTYNGGTDEWNDFGTEYLTQYEYDANGNITTLERHGYDTGAGYTRMDSILYTYKAGENNQLDYVFDAVTGDAYPTDPDLENTQSTGNYEYDEIGNLIQDYDEGNMAMEWDAYGKVKGVDRTFAGPVVQQIDYTYDARGNRVKKRVQQWSAGSYDDAETFYMYDAGGTVVAIYERLCEKDEITPPGGMPDADGDGWPDGMDNCPTRYNVDQRDSDGDGRGDSCDNCVCVYNPSQSDNDQDSVGNHCDSIMGAPPIPPVNDADMDGVANDHDNCPCTYNPSQEDSDFDGYGDSCDVCDYRLVELPIYGSSRIGVSRPNISIFDSPNTGPVYTRTLERKHYELTDHLGNVRVVLGDRKKTTTPGSGNYYADVEAYTHQYPFGMPQPGRTFDTSSLEYRYGFNGMETDPEVKGEFGNHYTTYFRQYDPRVGRWWSNDPVVHSWESPYVAFHDNPAYFSDPLGNDPPIKASNYDVGHYEKDLQGKWWSVVLDDNGQKVWQKAPAWFLGPPQPIMPSPAAPSGSFDMAKAHFRSDETGQAVSRTRHQSTPEAPPKRQKTSAEPVSTAVYTPPPVRFEKDHFQPVGTDDAYHDGHEYVVVEGAAWTMSASKWWEYRAPANNKEVAEYLSVTLRGIAKNTNNLIVFGAATLANDMISVPEIIFVGVDAGGEPVSEIERFLVTTVAGYVLGELIISGRYAVYLSASPEEASLAVVEAPNAAKGVGITEDIINNFSDDIIRINETTEGGGVLLQGHPSSAINTALYYSDAAEQGASIFRTIISNHMFVDGNKRTAVAALQLFAKNNGLLTVSEEELLSVATQIARGELTDISTIAKLIVK